MLVSGSFIASPVSPSPVASSRNISYLCLFGMCPIVEADANEDRHMWQRRKNLVTLVYLKAVVCVSTPRMPPPPTLLTTSISPLCSKAELQGTSPLYTSTAEPTRELSLSGATSPYLTSPASFSKRMRRANGSDRDMSMWTPTVGHRELTIVDVSRHGEMSLLCVMREPRRWPWRPGWRLLTTR